MEKAAEEADENGVYRVLIRDSWTRLGETPPATREAMFALMRDRLDDIDDLLFQDISPRELTFAVQVVQESRQSGQQLERSRREVAKTSITRQRRLETAPAIDAERGPTAQ